MKRSVSVILITSIIWFFSGCEKTDKKSYQSKSKLTIAMVVAEESEQTFERMRVLSDYFSKKLDMNVEILQISNFSAVIEAMRAKKIDVGSGGAFTYLVASMKADGEAIITTASVDGNPIYYTSSLITGANSQIKTIDDLLKNPKKYTLTWGYPTSTSGHLIPRYFLQQNKVMPEDFKEVFTSTNQVAATFSVISGNIDVAAISYSTVDRLIRTGKVKKSDIRVIWTSEPIPPGPVFVRKDMEPSMKKKIQQAYLEMPKDSTASKILRLQYTYDVKYIAVDDSFYQPLRNIANQIDGLKMEAEE